MDGDSLTIEDFHTIMLSQELSMCVCTATTGAPYIKVVLQRSSPARVIVFERHWRKLCKEIPRVNQALRGSACFTASLEFDLGYPWVMTLEPHGEKLVNFCMAKRKRNTTRVLGMRMSHEEWQGLVRLQPNIDCLMYAADSRPQSTDYPCHQMDKLCLRDNNNNL